MNKYKAAAAQLREDAEDCWGIRRKLNLRAAAKLLDQAADKHGSDLPGYLFLLTLTAITFLV